MHVYKVELDLKHGSCWTYKTSDFKVKAEVKYLFPLITKNSIFEIAEIYSDDKNELSEFISTINRRYDNNIKVANIDRPRSSKVALLYYFKNFDNSVTRVMIENNAVITNLSISNGIEEWYAYFFGEEEEILSNISHGLKKIDVKVENIDIEKTKVNDIKNDLAIINSLTPTEREILTTAIRLGFFEYPKKVRLEELAEMFGVTKVTLDRHIRNGLRKILSQLFINSQ
ncbi:helix-turn-helix domain-containing protein [Saccharolobus islandicus]|uniref:Bacterio-opsin activator HTH domain protein n=1 Tax=Saccharolobus islandicus (strain M.16.27) TaxID=427318 RepID=C3N1F9_SACI3|nr:helix-turn-helix domain-containing protein [Sulfolobus islandicus]ACP56186.1 Bacterio-opsin activator HTH domain protein [Sulfolobus islandicus M.16.27]